MYLTCSLQVDQTLLGTQQKKFMAFDLLSKSYDSLLDWANPEVIVHCAAITNLDHCEEHPEEAQAVNAVSLKKFLQSDAKAR